MALNNTVAAVAITEVDGLMQDGSYAITAGGLLSGVTPAPNPTVPALRELCFAGQTAATSASQVSHQAIGVINCPAAQATATTLTLTNGQIGANSFIFFQPKTVAAASSALVTNFELIVESQTATTTAAAGTCVFRVIFTGTLPVGGIDLMYWIVN